jgi:outer membrane receptor protein involved in Fe transport
VNRYFRIFATLIPAMGAALAHAQQDSTGPQILEDIIVTAGLRVAPLESTPASVTVLDAKTIGEAGVQHFEELLPLVPNLNFAGGSSRPRYFQIRGIGELDQYQGAPNPSVGFLIDDIDFSGVGMPATLFDTRSIDVLRGPQGTRYGANALAGLVSLQTMDASPEWEARAEGSVGSDSLHGLGAVIGGPVAGSDSLSFRLVAQREISDGFRHDRYLGRNATNGRDESTYRGKLHYRVGEDLDIRLTAMLVDIDDGYDAFSIDNSFTTLSDQPGRDSQRSAAGALHLEWQMRPAVRLVGIGSFAHSGIESSFDGDWGNNRDWAPYTPYQYFSQTHRVRSTLSQDLRLLGESGRVSWLGGLYLLRLTEYNAQHDQGQYMELAPLDDRLDSRYRATSMAAYAQTDITLGKRWTLTAGLRREWRQARYADTSNLSFDPRDAMLGGQMALRYQWAPRSSAYISASRGYKAGGFNIGTHLDPGRREFRPEYLWNFEAGLRNLWSEARMATDVTLFYALRRDQQVSTSYQAPSPSCPDGPRNPDGSACVDPLSFVYYTDNAARGVNYGVEASLRWRASPAVALAGTLGLLRTRYEDYLYGERSLDGRDQAHAPRYDFSLTADWRITGGWSLRADWSGKDSFYFDASNDQRSSAYTLLNLRLGFDAPHWSASLWAHNLFDHRYAVRGFYFGDEPPDFPDKLYVRWGDPRQIGLTATYRFKNP